MRGFPPTNSDDFEESVRSRCVQLDLGRIHRKEEDLYSGSGTVNRNINVQSEKGEATKESEESAEAKGEEQRRSPVKPTSTIADTIRLSATCEKCSSPGPGRYDCATAGSRWEISD